MKYPFRIGLAFAVLFALSILLPPAARSENATPRALIDLRDARSLRTIAWDALTPPGTAVEIRTRTGNDLREVGHYFLSSGEEVTKAE